MSMGIFHNLKTILFRVDINSREYHDVILNRKLHFETMRTLQVRDLKKNVDKICRKERINLKKLVE